MLHEFEDRDPRGWRPSPKMEYLIGGVATLVMLALLISVYSAVFG